MPTLVSSAQGAMSTMTWARAISIVAGSTSGANLPDSRMAARDSLRETLEDWDTRRDWRYTQVVSPDLTTTSGKITLPTAFKKPYVCYITGTGPLTFVERANWHRSTARLGSADYIYPSYYTLYNEYTSGQGDIWPAPDDGTTVSLLYYRPVIYEDDDAAVLDVPQRWTGYILAGARAHLALGKGAGGKAESWQNRYERGIKLAREDDQRMPDQFLTFIPNSWTMPHVFSEAPHLEEW